MSQMPAWAPATPPGLSRKTIRSSVGEKSGQFPGPRSFATRWSPSSSIDYKCETVEVGFPDRDARRGVEDDAPAVVRPRRRTALVLAGIRLVGDERGLPPLASIRYRPTWPAVAEGRAGWLRSCSTSRATAWPRASCTAFPLAAAARAGAAGGPWAWTNPQADRLSRVQTIVSRTMSELLEGHSGPVRVSWIGPLEDSTIEDSRFQMFGSVDDRGAERTPEGASPG